MEEKDLLKAFYLLEENIFQSITKTLDTTFNFHITDDDNEISSMKQHARKISNENMQYFESFIRLMETECNRTYIQNQDVFKILKNELSNKLTNLKNSIESNESDFTIGGLYYENGKFVRTLITDIKDDLGKATKLLERLPTSFMLHEQPISSKEAKTKKIHAPSISLFCNLVDKLGVDKRAEEESATVYCMRICNKYNLPYTERVRMNFNTNETNQLIKKFITNVLPLVDNETQEMIKKYLDTKHSPKQNLYA